MVKRFFCAIAALIFFVSTLVIPASAETTENGYEIPELCLKTDEPDVTNFAFELKRVHPGYVRKDGVIGENEYFPLGIPREEIILKGSNDQLDPAIERSQAIRDSVEAFVSWDYVHGVNVAVRYTSPETPVQQFSSLYYDGRLTPFPGSTKDDPVYNDSFNDDESFKAIGEDFWAQTAFSIQFGDKDGRVFYYCIGRNTETGEYLRGHYYFNSPDDNGIYQYGYDPTYIPAGGDDFVITYGEDNLVTMEWSVPFSVILGREPVDGEKIGLSMTLTQGTNPPGYNPDDPDEPRDPWKGDLINNAAVLLGNCAGFQSLAAKPTRTKKQNVRNPVTDELITSKTAGNLPMVAFINTTEPSAPEPVHVHDYKAVTVDPTCTEPGYTAEVCECGDTVNRVDIPALGHDYAATVTEPTCTEGGYTTYVCSRCSDTYVADETNALGHAPGEAVRENEVEATCTVGAYWEEAVYCTRCGEELSREVKTTEALGHEYGEWIIEKEATEDEEGLKYHVCSRCGSREDQVIPKADHVHDYEAVVTDPTCTERGYTTYTCRCGDTYVDDYVDALGHAPGEVVIENEVEATCTAGAYREEAVYCTRCGEELSREVKTTEALGHDYVATVTEPTCTEAGYTTYVCSRCGDTYVADEVNALGHDWGEWIVDYEPTEESGGLKHHVCTRCGESEEEKIPALDHVHDYVPTVTEPTCTERGYTTYVCRCGDTYVDDYVDALGHAPGEVVIENKVEATCTVGAYWEETVYCTRCGEELSREVKTTEALGHDYEATVTEPTCTEGGYTTYVCSRCSDTYVDGYVDALGHDWGEWTVEKEATEEEEGLEARVCARCGEREERATAKLDHVHVPGEVQIENKVEATCTVGAYWEEVIYCTACGEELSRDVKTTEALGHDYEATVTDPTCTERGYTTYVCTRCGDTYVDGYVDALGHTFSEWAVTAEPTCTGTGVEKRECAVCGEVEERAVAALGHDYEATLTDPTCTERGYTTYVCTRCGDTYVDDYVDALGHTFGAWAVTAEPTCTGTGSEKRTCSVCGETEERAIAALGHAWDDGVVTLEPTVDTDGVTLYTCTRCGETKEVAIPKLSHVPGDINGDKKVTSKDLTRLMKYLADNTTPVNEAALDVNGDGVVNSKDLTRLLRYIAGENVELH